MQGQFSWRLPRRSLVIVLILTAAYGIAGRLSLLLAIPPGYATAIWPPAGMALVAVLMGGTRVWPGIWLGSVLANVPTAFDATTPLALLTSVVIPTILGLGATLQALLGGCLVRRIMGFPTALTETREILLFLLLGGPLSCLVSATVGVTTLAVSGQIPWAIFDVSWGTWWGGDTLGVLIVTPLALSYFAEPRQIWRRRRLSVALPLVGALALAIGVFGYTRGQERERLTLLFEGQAATLTQAFRTRLDEALEVLAALESFYASAPAVSRRAFHTFVQRALARHPGLQALSWGLHVLDGEREAYEEAIRQEGYPTFQITELDGHAQLVRAARRPEYIVVTYIEPFTENERALGFDVASAPDRREALQRAGETGQPHGTGRLTLVQERGRDAGFLVFLPIYDLGPPPTTVAERRQRLQGYVAGVFRIGEMVAAALPGLEGEGITLRIEDETAPAGQRLLYDSRGLTRESPGLPHEGPREGPTGMSWETIFEVVSRRWVLHFAPTLAYVAARQSWQPWAVLSGGLAFASLLGAFLLIVTGRTSMIEQLMAERTAQLKASRREEGRFRVAVEAAPNAMLMVDQAGTIVLLNAHAEALFGYARAELIGQPVERLVPERYRRQHPAHRAGFFMAPDTRPMGAGRELFGLHKDGHEIPVEIGLNPFRTEEGRFVLAAVIDISARKQAEARFRLAVEAAPNAMVMVNQAGTIVLVNAQTEQLFGYARGELIGQSVELLVPKRFRHQHPDSRADFFAAPQVRPMGAGRDLYGRRKDGSEFPVEIGLNPIETEEGVLVLSAIVDITARKRAEEAIRALNHALEQRVRERTAQLEAANQELASEIAERTRAAEALQASERKFRSVVESAADAIILADSAGRILAWNQGAQATFGYDEAEIVSQPLTCLMPERYRELHRNGLERLRATGTSRVLGRTVELHGLRKDGREFPLELALSSWSVGADTYYTGIIRDTTARKQAEEVIRTLNTTLEQRVLELNAANQELAAFSYSIAHDLRAPLRAIHGFSQILLEEHAPQLEAEVQGYLQRVSANALRMGQLITDLLAFAQLSQQPLRKERVALGDLVREVLDDLRPAYAHRQVDLAIGELPACQADPALLRQVWVNLLENALKFTQQRPVARIAVGCHERQGERVYFVRDNGAGFDMQYADKLFGVFQRLHRTVDYEGTGVGLALTQRIIQRHGGRIWAEAAVDQGATFFFTLGT